MRSLSDRLQLAKTILRELSRQPLNRTELEKRTTRRFGTHATFDGMFHFLVQGGYVQKREQKHRAAYRITEKGAAFMEVI
jgi:DNA-binding PadR family transcriptional regulator